MSCKDNRHRLSLPHFASRGDMLVATAWCAILIAGVCRADDAPAGPESPSSGQTEQAALDAVQQAEEGPAELSVAPLEFPLYPEDRPEWLDEPPELDGTIDSWPVVSVPALDPERCRENLFEQARVAIEAYAEHLFAGDGGRLTPPFQVPDAHVHRVLQDAPERYVGTVVTSDGEMFERAVRLQFDAALRDDLRAEWRSQQVAQRLAGLGLLGGGSLVGVIALSTFLRCAGYRKRSA